MSQTKDDKLIEEMIKEYEDSLKVDERELDYESLGVTVSKEFLWKIKKQKKA